MHNADTQQPRGERRPKGRENFPMFKFFLSCHKILLLNSGFIAHKSQCSRITYWLERKGCFIQEAGNWHLVHLGFSGEEKPEVSVLPGTSLNSISNLMSRLQTASY